MIKSIYLWSAVLSNLMPDIFVVTVAILETGVIIHDIVHFWRHGAIICSYLVSQ